MLNVIVTGLMVIFYAAAVYLNQLVVVPVLRRYDSWQYFMVLAALLITLNIILLSMIRYVYAMNVGDHLLGDYWQHFAIDLFGMVLHVSVAAAINRTACRFRVEWD